MSWMKSAVMLEKVCREREAARIKGASEIIGRVFEEAYRRVRSVKEAEAQAGDFVGLSARRIRAWRNGEVQRIADDEYRAIQAADAALLDWRIEYHRAELARAEAEEQQLVARIQAGREALRTSGLVAMVRQDAERRVGPDFSGVSAAGPRGSVVPAAGRDAHRVG